MFKFSSTFVAFFVFDWICVIAQPPQCYTTHDPSCSKKHPRYRYNFWNYWCESYLYSGCPPEKVLWNNFYTYEDCVRIAYPVCRPYKMSENETTEATEDVTTNNDNVSHGSGVNDDVNTNKRQNDGVSSISSSVDENLDILEDEETIGKLKLTKREKLILAMSTSKLKRCTQKCHTDVLRSLLD